jgi:hypothetical protein
VSTSLTHLKILSPGILPLIFFFVSFFLSEETEIDVNLLLQNDDPAGGDHENVNELLVIRKRGDKIVIPKSGTITISITITATSMRYENKKFLIEVIPKSSSISSIRTIPLFVVTHRLIITQPAPTLWYKDQGGKENCIDLHVNLVDNHQQIVKSRRVPLKLTLLYEGGNHCLKQDILRVHGTAVVGETGQSLVRVRIEEVSRSHQKQSFVIQIAPDTHRYPLNNDISPADSTPIDVMSKPRPIPAAAPPASHNTHSHHLPSAAPTSSALMANKKRAKDEMEHFHDSRPTQVQRLGPGDLPLPCSPNSLLLRH